MSTAPDLRIIFAVMEEVATSDGHLQSMRVKPPLFTDREVASARIEQLNGPPDDKVERPDPRADQHVMTVREVLAHMGLRVSYCLVPMEILVTSEMGDAFEFKIREDLKDGT